MSPTSQPLLAWHGGALGAVVVCGCCLLLAITAALAGPAQPQEYEVKAAFLYNFTKFVEWPPRAFGGQDDPMVVGVLGAPRCAAALEQLVRGRKVNGRALVVRRIERDEDVRSVQLLFVGAGAEARFARLLASLAGAPVLTVGESAAFAESGGAINFVLEDSKVRFEINAPAAERVGVRISAQMLKLARPPARGS